MTATDQPRRKPGRPFAPPRAEIKVRMPPPLREALRKAARAEGVSENEWVMRLMAQSLQGEERAWQKSA